MDTYLNDLYDRQSEPAVAHCAHCGGEIYGADDVYLFDGRMVHDDCLAAYAEANCRKARATDNRDLAFVQRYLDAEIENFKNTIWNRFVGLANPHRLIQRDERLYCPGCGKFFSDVHAADKPNYCENCGQALDWPDTGEIE